MSITHKVFPDINNPQWRYVSSEKTNLKQRFEDHGHKYQDSLYDKKWDFSGLEHWVYIIHHREEGSHG